MVVPPAPASIQKMQPTHRVTLKPQNISNKHTTVKEPYSMNSTPRTGNQPLPLPETAHAHKTLEIDEVS